MDQVSEFFGGLFSTSGFPPRWHCGRWTELHGWLYVASDITIWLAYFIIPTILVLFIQRRRDIPFLPVFWLFGAFIVLCGTSHLVDAIMFWAPAYRVNALVRLATAIVSMITVVHLIKILPQALSLKGAVAFDLERSRRIEAERELESARAELEVLRRQLAKV
ncbi:MAG TPA: hypothetical protein VNO30_36075 [Kofleriaceae bacterium]|nr:hypothetical protein [Kofleriaceae bacterium]